VNIKLAAVLVITTVCLVWALWGLELTAFLEVMSQVRWTQMVLVVVCYICGHTMRTLRLNLLLEKTVSFRGMFSVISIGFMAINVMPLRLGELVRPYLLLEQHEVPFGASLAAVLLERLLDLAALAVLLLLLSFAVELPPNGIRVGDLDVVEAGQRFTGVVMAMGVVALAGVLWMGQAIVQRMQRLRAPGPAIGSLLESFRQGLTQLIRRPAVALQAVFLTAVVWAFTLAAVRYALSAFPDLPATWAASLSTWSITMTGLLVAPTPGFFGTYEAFCKASLLLWGVDANLAATFAVVLHMTMFLFSLALGGIFLVLEGLSLGRVVRASRKAHPESSP